MSIQFGRWNFDGKPNDPQFLCEANRILEKYAPGTEGNYSSGGTAILFRGFQTTCDSAHEQQPLLHPTGLVLTWDGRLDNRKDLVERLRMGRDSYFSEAEIVLAAFEKWGAAAFAALLGDWALALWDSVHRTLLLGKDFVGTRHLFYAYSQNQVTWSTVLDPLVLLTGHPHKISEDFVAGYLSTGPDKQVTPFAGMSAVPAGSFVRIRESRLQVEDYWRINDSRIHHPSDMDYEQHFTVVFKEAVRRRLQSSPTVLAELSGGVDSTSIVCMADRIIAEGSFRANLLETISYYDDSEPNWNERPYFSLVEKARGRLGHHISVSGWDGAFEAPEGTPFLVFPGVDRLWWNRLREFGRCLESSKAQVVLSGIGGDEFLGGVPTSIPELQDLFVSLRWRAFSRQLVRFGLQQRRPCLHLCADVLRDFLPEIFRIHRQRRVTPPWLTTAFVKQCSITSLTDRRRIKVLGPCPSFQDAILTFEQVRRQLNTSLLSPTANCRKTYPYLDRDLLAFLFAIPREQLVRPGQRRSLVRRALRGLVPPEVLNRSRKAFVVRQPLALLEHASARIEALLRSPLIADYGWVDVAILREHLKAIRCGQIEYMVPMLATLKLELWLRTINECRPLSILTSGFSGTPADLIHR